MRQAILPQVKKIVFLMLENRSLDNVLGWLYAGSAPDHVFPRNRPKEYDGLVVGRFSNPSPTTGEAVLVQPVPDGVWADGYSPPYWDPYEMLKKSPATWPFGPYPWNGVMNQLFGDEKIIPGLPTPASGAPAMKGFLQDYYSGLMTEWKGHDVLWTYTPQQLPVINGLARRFAVSDRWFCSVPSQTNPNRAYSICGTSLGRESNQALTAQEQFDAPTLFNALAQAGKSWGLYFTDRWMGTKSYTEYTFPRMSGAGDSETGELAKFFQRAKEGTLPDFTYLEPKWGGIFSQGTDYHPGIDADVRPAEAFLREVFQAVREGKSWDETLFIITFDEHGGTYDHFPPPWGAINPDGRNGVENGFEFDLFGARVPTILVSPFVKAGTVFRAPEGSRFPFDHTSFIKTVLLWAGVDLGSVSLGRRMPEAPTFEGVLADQPVNEGTLTVDATEAHPAASRAVKQAHPAGPNDELKALLDGIPVVPRRAILGKSNTLPEVQEEAARYRADPQKFEAMLGSELARRG